MPTSSVQLPDVPTVPHAFYVSVRGPGGRTILALGPFARHARALGHVDHVRRAITRAGLDPYAEFGYGTCRMPLRGTLPAGMFAAAFNVAPDIRRVPIGPPAGSVPAPVLERIAAHA